jgi:pyruvate kinase
MRGSWGVQEIYLSPATDIGDLCDFAVTQIKLSGLAKTGDTVVVMAGSASGGAAITDTVRMIIVP